MNNSNIVCIWYPSGGFGHFVNTLICRFGPGFAKSDQTDIVFSNNGNSHLNPYVAPLYRDQHSNYTYKFDPELRYSVLVDNGITNEGQRFKEVFPGANVVKLCYSDRSWPIVARTLIEKALSQSLDQALTPGDDWQNDADWSRREKYFLYLRDHDFRHCWRPAVDSDNILVDEIIDSTQLQSRLEQLQLVDGDIREVWQQWRTANARYIDPVQQAQYILQNIDNQLDLTAVTDLWTQAVVNYFIWLDYGVEVPANDYAAWFANTQQIKQMLDQANNHK